MKTIIHTLAALLAAAFPVAFAIEMFGVTLPQLFNAEHAFIAFVMVLTLVTVAADYRAPKSLRTSVARPTDAPVRSTLPLAA